MIRSLDVRTLVLSALCVAACAGGSGARGGGASAAAEEGPPPRPCTSDDDCPLATPFCMAFDRAGGQRGPGPTTRRCVAGCESDGDCGPGYRCGGRYETFQEEEHEGQSFGMALSQGVCSPIPRYGPGRLGAGCEVDEDCGEDAPHCVAAGSRRLCTRLCETDCPRGYRCRDAQVLRAGRTVSVRLCAPAR